MSVAGAVAAPDVYDLPPGSIVKDALESAGGATADADLTQLNLARTVIDQEHILVPVKGQIERFAPVTASESVRGGINLNLATATELESLPGIGPSLAQRILDYRREHGPFRSLEDLDDVPGVGLATIDRLRNDLFVE